MNVPKEKRSNPRTALHQLVQFERTAAELCTADTELTQGVGRDISPAGASFLTSCPLQQGEILRVRIPAELEHHDAPVISEVKWTQPTRHGFRVGLQFLA
ncbi:PilZ domain-containing protein [Geothrix fuzhouensis]|uniref:PilZ domain-containing protein n=1 Tax=Geothrix fuzhouensis TaxID=2966451 RepID=UPI002149335D|nr:PilZ domain-containing protein [Geothrix fuzhouensis]